MLTHAPLSTGSRIPHQARSLREAGYRVTVITPDARPASTGRSDRRFSIDRLDLGSSSTGMRPGRRFVRAAAERLAALHPDGVHAVGPVALEAAARFARRARKRPRLVYDAPPGAEPNGRLALAPRRWLALVDLVLVGRPGLGCGYRTRMPGTPVRTVRTRFPRVDLTPSLALPRRLGLGPEDSLIFVPSSAHADVGLRSLVAALGRLPARVHAVLGGYGSRRAPAAAWRDLARAAGLTDRIHVAWFASREEMVTWARGARLGCVAEAPAFPPDLDESEQPILHCLAAGLPTLVPARLSDDSDLSMMGRGAVCRVDVADRWALRDAIGSLLGDSDKLRQMALAARRAAENECWEREAEALLDAYLHHVGPPRVDRGVRRRSERARLEPVARGE